MPQLESHFTVFLVDGMANDYGVTFAALSVERDVRIELFTKRVTQAPPWYIVGICQPYDPRFTKLAL